MLLGSQHAVLMANKEDLMSTHGPPNGLDIESGYKLQSRAQKFGFGDGTFNVSTITQADTGGGN